MAEKSTRVTRSSSSKKNAASAPTTSPFFESQDVSPPPARKKKSSTPASLRKRKHVEVTQDDDQNEPAESSGASKKQKKEALEEKRLKTFRSKAPQSFLQKLARAQTQRMIVIGRTRHGQGEELHEDIDIVGTTGNIYTVTIGRLPSCTCPDHGKGNECKHKVYALHTVLRAPTELQYQRAFLTAEVEEILANAPPIPNATSDSEEDNDGKRKPIEGECPICYMDFDPDNNAIVWCKAACGNNMHKDCFDQWAASQRGQEVRCVYCRQPWQMEKGDLEAVKKSGEQSGDGYVNVAEQFGLSRARDVSTYNQFWVRRHYGYGR